MDLYDWLLSLHVLSAFLVGAALTALWALVLASRPAAPVLDGPEAGRLGAFAGPVVGIGLAGTIIFGVWLALDADAYGIFDGWVLASLVLWLVAGGTGDRSGRLFGAGERGPAIAFQAVSTVATLAILVLMIWKPGA